MTSWALLPREGPPALASRGGCGAANSHGQRLCPRLTTSPQERGLCPGGLGDPGLTEHAQAGHM